MFHRNIGGLYLHFSQQLVPESEHAFESFVDGSDTAETRVDLARCGYGFSFAEQEDHLAGFAWSEFDGCLDRQAWIKAGAVATTQSDAPQSCRLPERAVATDEFRPIASHREARFAGADPGNSVRKLIVVGIAREDRPFLLFQVRDHVRPGRFAADTQHQFLITRNRESATMSSAIAQAQ